MNVSRRKRIKESALVLMGALDRMRKIYDAESAALELIPYTDEFEDERDEQEEYVEKLEEAISDLEEALEILSDGGFCDTVAKKTAVPSSQVPEQSLTSAQDASLPVSPTPPAKERKLGCLGWLLASALPLSIAGPLIAIFVILYLGDGGALFLFLSIACVALYVLFVLYVSKKLREPLPPTSSNKRICIDTSTDYDREEEQASAFLGGMLGGYFLGKALNKDRKSFSEKFHDDIFWQEKYRRHDDYYGDDW